MAAELLNDLIERSGGLTPEEKQRLARFLSEQVGGDSTGTQENVPEEKLQLAALLADQGRGENAGNGGPFGINTADPDPQSRNKRLAWVKAHREEYSGQYVALDGDRLTGHGSSMRDAVEQSRENGCNNPFVAYVLSSEVVADGGL